MVIMGWFNIYAAVYNEEHKAILDLSQRYGKQFIWILATLVLAVFIVVIDSRFYHFFSYFIYAGVMLLLVLVLVLGKEINGARSWFEFGNISLQPSEFAKFGTALGIAAYLSNKRQDLTKIKSIIPALGIMLFPALLTALQPDMGSTIVFLAFFIVLFREGLSPFVFVSGILMVILFFLTLLVDNFYLEAGLVVVALFLSWFATRNLKVWLIGLVILIVTGGIMYTLGHFVFKSMGNEIILLITIVFTARRPWHF
jgi:rod shape determining protein RodA